MFVEGADIPCIALEDAAAVHRTGPRINPVEGIADQHGAAIGDSEAARAGGVPGAAEHVFRGPVCEGGLDLQAVADAGGKILELESAGHRIAPGRGRMAGITAGRGVIGPVHFVRRGRDVRRSPGLVEPQIGDDVGRMIADLRIAEERAGGGAVVEFGAPEGAEERRRGVDDAGEVMGRSVFQRQRGRQPVIERGGIGQHRDADHVVRAAQEAGRDVGPVSYTHLDVYKRQEIFLVVGSRAVVAALPVRRVVDAAMDRGVDAHAAANADAGVGAGDGIEARAVRCADPDIVDRFDFYGQIGCKRADRGGESCCGAEHQALDLRIAHLRASSMAAS